MKIVAKTSADIVGFAIKRNQAHDGKEAYVDLDISIKHEHAALFGDSFEALAFSSMQESTDEESGAAKTTHLLDSIKPGKRVVYEQHRVVVAGHQFTEQPELLNIRTIDGDARVVAKFRLPVAVHQSALVNELVAKVGGAVPVEFEPQQGQFEFTQRANDDVDHQENESAAAQ